LRLSRRARSLAAISICPCQSRGRIEELKRKRVAQAGEVAM